MFKLREGSKAAKGRGEDSKRQDERAAEITTNKHIRESERENRRNFLRQEGRLDRRIREGDAVRTREEIERDSWFG